MAVAPEPGELIGGRYRLIEVAGRGGMADVWRAEVEGDLGFRRTVAIKQMHPGLAGQPTYVQMFVEEARLGAALESPNLAEVRDFIAHRGNYYMVLEWVEGIDLGTWVRWHFERGEAPRWELVAAIGVGVLRGLAAAHERHVGGVAAPVVHRDVSPHNVMLTTRGLAKLIDFGLALAADRTADATEPGVVKGKMAYLSPEIVSGARPVPASDQFAVGSVMWEALVGRKLFDGANDYETYVRVRDCQVPPLKPLRPDVPADVAALIARALAPRVDQRYPSAREFARQLGTALKKVQLRRDLHALLSRSVSDARASMGLGARTGDLSALTPIAELRPEEQATAFGDRLRGLRHKLPGLFGRKKS
ncbi:MAG: serine/threonine protein kinase [Kofleriaceae bacterium]|nr:serine/threonine protein kinase [Kofleriaceae bacterium]MBP9166941.1 serine/threonine protein kinase [Kofleriaceae bacterium]MBP9862451.1 serine/threonine protein kinase [Kofleriaceae bacterium]